MINTRKLNLSFKESCRILQEESFEEVLAEIQPSKNFIIDLSSLKINSLRLVVHEGDWIKKGTPICHLKHQRQVQFVSSVSGKIIKIERGDKRCFERLVIEGSHDSDEQEIEPLNIDKLTKEAFIDHMNRYSCAFRVFSRPFKRIADLSQSYDALFVNAAKVAPYGLPLSFQMAHHSEAIEMALRVFKKFYTVHFVSDRELGLDLDILNYQVSGTWMTSLTSWHIHKIHPILSIEQKVLTIDLEDLIYCGYSFLGKQQTQKYVLLTGEGVKDAFKGIYKMQICQSLQDFIKDKVNEGQVQLISGNPLTGHEVQKQGALFPSDNVLSVLSIKKFDRRLYHMRASFPSFSSTAGYFTSYRNAWKNTLMYGQERAFIAQEFYDKTMPIDLEIIPLIKAVLAEDYEKAIFLGLLEVDPEDFALATFVCPSKIEMMQIVAKGQAEAYEQLLI